MQIKLARNVRQKHDGQPSSTLAKHSKGSKLAKQFCNKQTNDLLSPHSPYKGNIKYFQPQPHISSSNIIFQYPPSCDVG